MVGVELDEEGDAAMPSIGGVTGVVGDKRGTNGAMAAVAAAETETATMDTTADDYGAEDDDKGGADRVGMVDEAEGTGSDDGKTTVAATGNSGGGGGGGESRATRHTSKGNGKKKKKKTKPRSASERRGRRGYQSRIHRPGPG